MNNTEIPNHKRLYPHPPSRVLFLMLSPLPSPSAAWARIGFFACYLKSLGINVMVAGAFSAKTLEQAGSIGWNGITIYNWVPVIMLPSLIAQILNIVLASFVSLFLFLKIRPHVLVISVPSSGNPWGCYLVARLFKCKVITDYRDEWEDYNYGLSRTRVTKKFFNTTKNAMTKCYRGSEIVITPTEPFATSLRRRGIKNVVVIRNGADTTVFRPKDKFLCREKIGFSIDDLILIYSGHVGAYYRLDILIRALKQTIEEYNTNLKLIIAGHGSGMQTVLKLAHDIGLQDKVFYIGRIMNKDELADAICASDIGIIPYDSNPLWKNSIPVKALEYLACGLPIIATIGTNSLLGKLIVENQLGLVARPEDIDSLSGAIIKLKIDNDLRVNAGARALSLIGKEYDRHKLAGQFYSFLERYLNHGP